MPNSFSARFDPSIMERAEYSFFRSINPSIWENPDQIVDEERNAWPSAFSNYN
jgi:hypothetical protein